MGALAEAIVAYAQPLLDQTDGSIEQMNKAMTLGQCCYNLALLSEDGREEVLRGLRTDFEMGEAEFDEFRRSIIDPMIRRHEQMFPRLHNRGSAGLWGADFPPLESSEPPVAKAPAKAPASPDRYAPCPCGSGEKYKFCCGKNRR